MRNLSACLVWMVLTGCASESGMDPGSMDPGGGSSQEQADETVVSYFVVETTFDNTYGQDSRLAEAVGPLLDLDRAGGITIGGFMANAAPGHESEVVAAVDDILTASPYLLSDAADAAQRLLEGQETFRVEHELQIVEDANGERFLRDNIFGFRFWNQTITELGSYSWSSMVPMENAVMGTRLPLQQNGATLTVPSHQLRFQLGLAALTFLHGETFPIDDACSIVIATRVAQQVSGTDPQAMVSACEAGVAGLEKGVRDALAALDSPIDLELQGAGTIENAKISGVWQGSLTTAMIPTSSLVNARFK